MSLQKREQKKNKRLIFGVKITYTRKAHGEGWWTFFFFFFFWGGGGGGGAYKKFLKELKD